MGRDPTDSGWQTSTAESIEKYEEPPAWATVNINRVSVERLRHFGDVYLGLQLWNKLSFFVPLLLGIWWRRANATGAMWSMIGGFIVSIIMHPATPLFHVKPPFLAGIYGVITSLFWSRGLAGFGCDDPVVAPGMFESSRERLRHEDLDSFFLFMVRPTGNG